MTTVPVAYRLTLLTTLAEVKQGPRWSATETATGHVAYSFSKLSRAAIVRFLTATGGLVGRPGGAG